MHWAVQRIQFCKAWVHVEFMYKAKAVTPQCVIQGWGNYMPTVIYYDYLFAVRLQLQLWLHGFAKKSNTIMITWQKLLITIKLGYL